MVRSANLFSWSSPRLCVSLQIAQVLESKRVLVPYSTLLQRCKVCYPEGCAAPSFVPCQCNTRGSLSKLKGAPPQRKINVTCKSPVGDISVVTLIRTDTTLDHSQKAEKVCSCRAQLLPLVQVAASKAFFRLALGWLHPHHFFSDLAAASPLSRR